MEENDWNDAREEATPPEASPEAEHGPAGGPPPPLPIAGQSFEQWLQAGFDTWNGIKAGLKAASIGNQVWNRTAMDVTSTGGATAALAVTSFGKQLSLSSEAVLGVDSAMKVEQGAELLSRAIESVAAKVGMMTVMGSQIAGRSLNTTLSGATLIEKTVGGLVGFDQAFPGGARRQNLWETLHALFDIIHDFTAMSPLQFISAIKALSALQAGARLPPCSDSTNLSCIDDAIPNFGESRLRKLLRRRYRQSLSLLPHHMLKFLGYDSPAEGDVTQEDVIFFVGKIPEEDLIHCQFESGISQPAHCVFLDHHTKTICITIRGTTHITDVVTDLRFTSLKVNDEGQAAHHGMQTAAEHLDALHRQRVQNLCLAYPDYTVVCQGHSLGAGTAALLTMIWMEDDYIAGPAPDRQRIHCFAFSSPCIVSREKSRSTRKNITTVIRSKDIVGRLSGCTVRRLAAVLNHISQCIPVGPPADVPTDSRVDLADRAFLENLLEGLTVDTVNSMVQSVEECIGAADSPSEKQMKSKPLRDAWRALRLLYERDPATQDAQLLFPAGRALLFVSSDELTEAGCTAPPGCVFQCNVENFSIGRRASDVVDNPSQPSGEAAPPSVPSAGGTATQAPGASEASSGEGAMWGRLVTALEDIDAQHSISRRGSTRHTTMTNVSPQVGALSDWEGVCLELGDNVHEMASEIILSGDAIRDHMPLDCAIALGVGRAPRLCVE